MHEFPHPPGQGLAPLLRLEVQVGELLTLGAMAVGERRMVVITGGRFEGAGDLQSWLLMLGGFDIVFATAGWLSFDFLLEE